MDKKLILALLPVVNSPHDWPDFLQYIQYRIQWHKDQMVHETKSLEDLRAHQGAVKELTHILQLKDLVQRLGNEMR